MPNEDVAMTLDEAVAEVMGLLTGLDLEYIPELDRYQAITRQLNRAMRAVALDNEWSYYSDTENVGTAHYGDQLVVLRNKVRPRTKGDDAVLFKHPDTGRTVAWAYFLPRDALEKYPVSGELKVAYAKQTLTFSRPFHGEDGLDIYVPVMREPRMFRLPEQPEDPDEELVTVDQDTRDQGVDFEYPDLVVRKAAYFYAQTNPLWQPRVQTLDANYKELMYPLVERDNAHTDAPFQNEWHMGIQSDIFDQRRYVGRPNADWQNWH